MPYLRLFGNAVLSFVAKLATGYWHLMDPTNGYTAIHRTALAALPLHRIDRRYFFESDMLFRLYTIRAVAQDVPMRARYGNETSSLSVRRAALSFPGKYANRFAKRFFYAYILRDFNAGSAAAILGLLLVLAGGSFGAAKWIANAASGVTTTTGTVMLAAIPLLLGGHLLISAFNFDIGNAPTRPLQSDLSARLDTACARRRSATRTRSRFRPAAAAGPGAAAASSTRSRRSRRARRRRSRRTARCAGW